MSHGEHREHGEKPKRMSMENTNGSYYPESEGFSVIVKSSFLWPFPRVPRVPRGSFSVGIGELESIFSSGAKMIPKLAC
jgi:hypothetical protein